MTILLVAAGLIAGTGAIAALAPVDVRLGLIGLTAALVGAALLADPLPAPAILAVRLSAALLAVASLQAATSAIATFHRAEHRGWSRHLVGSQLGWPAEILLGIGGAAAGLAIAAGLATFSAVGGGDVGQPGTPVATDLLSAPSLALGVAGLIAAIALGPVVVEPGGLRRSMAGILLTQASILVLRALAPSSGVLGEVILATLLVVVAAAGAMLVAASATAGASPMPVRPVAASATTPEGDRRP